MLPSLREIGFAQLASVRFRTWALNPDGRLDPLRDWTRNLVLDSGLDSVGARTWNACTNHFCAGSGTGPTARDSGATTASRSGSTVTASAGFFVAADVGRLIRFDSGEEDYISGYTSATEVATVGSGSISAAEFGVHYVNDNALGTELKRSSTASSLGAGNGSAWNAGISAIVDTKTRIFSAESGAVTYNELGWSWGTAGTALFGRAVLSGGDSLVAGQQYVVSMQLTRKLSPVTVTAAGNVGTAIDTSGNAMIESVVLSSSGVSAFQPVGSANSIVGLEPGVKGTEEVLMVLLATWTQQTAPSTSAIAAPTRSVKVSVAEAYSTGSFTRRRSAEWSTSEGNGTLHGIALGIGESGTPSMFFTVKFTATQTKLNTQTLTVYFRHRWQRDWS